VAATLSARVGGAAPAIRRRRPRTGRFRRVAIVLLFMAPWIIGFFAFILYPMLASLYFSFTKYNLLQPPEWVGLFNYKFMFLHDPLFWQSVRNTVWIVVFGVPVSIVFAVGTAMVLTRVKVGSSVYRTMFFLPTMVPAVAATLAFVFLLNPSGPINTILRLLHIPQPLWFASPQWSKPALVGLSLWAIGETMIIFLAALLDVPRQLYEAADMEGAGPWQKFRHVTLPMISPVIFFSVVIGVIFGFQYFTQAYIASGGQLHLGEPQGSMRFYAVWMFQQIQYSHMGYASALAWVLFLVVMACTVVLIKASRRWVHYQGGFR